MATQIATKTHGEFTGLTVTITDTEQGVHGRFMVRRDAPGTVCGPATIQTGRATEAEARQVANLLWLDAVAKLRAAQAPSPFEVVGEVVAEMTEDQGVTITGRTWDPTMVTKRFDNVESIPMPAAEPFAFADKQLHEVGGEVYRVKVSKTSGRPYAERLISDSGKPVWAYTPGAMNRLGPDTLMSEDRRAELGRIMVHCLDCGAHLTHPISVARGIGPVCSGLGYSE
jgi:hypothetical protein